MKEYFKSNEEDILPVDEAAEKSLDICGSNFSKKRLWKNF
jgi:hypothetical protein